MPAGTVTFVLTDIEGSTRLLRHLGDRYAAVLERHRALLRGCWDVGSGHEIDCQGDSFFVAFPDAGSAVRACVAAQRAVEAETWPSGGRVAVRMGVHTGLAAPIGDRYVALAVHQAARVADVAHGGQILASEASMGELTGELTHDSVVADDVTARPLGRYRVRDFDRPVELFQIEAPGLLDDFPAVRALPADRHNLAPPPTRLWGREGDLASLVGSVAGHRLVTVVGPGGVGKSRLVTEFGMRVAEEWPGGAWLVDCSVTADEDLMNRALADALDPVVGRGEADLDGLIAGLRDQRLLVILDGCEPHLTVVATAVNRLLRWCPGIHVLATSTEPLRVAGEALHRLAPLTVSGAAGSPALELFAERAEAAVPGFRVDAATAPTVEAICRHLDGLPLALEIAAAKLTALHPRDILAGLERRFELLREREGPRPARQRTLRGLLDWSWRLLPPDEAETLSRLSLLAGPFDLDVARAAMREDAQREDAAVLVWSLVDRSLVVAEPAAGGSRYRLLETVRAYARERLDETDRRGSVDSLIRYYVDRLGPERGTGTSWVHAFAAELATVRSLLAELSPPGDGPAQALACALARYHDAVQSYRDGVREIARLADRLTDAGPARVGLLCALGDLRLRLREGAAAEGCADAARRLRDAVGDPPWDETGVDKLAGEIALHRGDPEAAVRVAAAALQGSLSARGRARMHNLLGIALTTQGRVDQAADAFADELAAATELGDEVLLAHAHANVAEVALRRGRVAQAARHQRTCLDLALALGRTGMVAYGLLTAARIASLSPDADDEGWAVAVQLVARALELIEDTGLGLHETDRLVTEQWIAAARARLGAERFAREELVGRRLGVDRALASSDDILAAATTAAVRSNC